MVTMLGAIWLVAKTILLVGAACCAVMICSVFFVSEDVVPDLTIVALEGTSKRRLRTIR
jgi:hypothetical protein